MKRRSDGGLDSVVLAFAVLILIIVLIAMSSSEIKAQKLDLGQDKSVIIKRCRELYPNAEYATHTNEEGASYLVVEVGVNYLLWCFTPEDMCFYQYLSFATKEGRDVIDGFEAEIEYKYSVDPDYTYHGSNKYCVDDEYCLKFGRPKAYTRSLELTLR